MAGKKHVARILRLCVATQILEVLEFQRQLCFCLPVPNQRFSTMKSLPIEVFFKIDKWEVNSFFQKQFLVKSSLILI